MSEEPTIEELRQERAGLERRLFELFERREHPESYPTHSSQVDNNEIRRLEKRLLELDEQIKAVDNGRFI